MSKNEAMPSVLSRIIDRALDHASQHADHAQEAVAAYREKVDMFGGGETTGRPHMDRMLLGEVMRRAMMDVGQLAMALGELLPVAEVRSAEHADILEEHTSKVAELEGLLRRYVAEIAELAGHAAAA